MADFGTFNTRTLPVTLRRAGPAAVVPTADPVFNVNTTLGTISARSITIGGGAGTIFVDRPVYTPIPPSASSAGDWPMRFFAAQLSPSTVVGGVENIPNLYVCGASSKLYVRYYEVRNYSGGNVTVTINMAEYPVVRASTVANGASLPAPAGFNMILWPGDVIEAKVHTDVDDVWILVTGVETVT
jgi:hypothetical protein